MGEFLDFASKCCSEISVLNSLYFKESLPHDANLIVVTFFHCVWNVAQEATDNSQNVSWKLSKKSKYHSQFSRNIRSDSKDYSTPQSKPKGFG